MNPVNPNATIECKQVLDLLTSIKGKHTLIAQHDFITSGTRHADTVFSLTGKHPVIWGSDFSFGYIGNDPKRIQHCGPLNITQPGEPPVINDVTADTMRDALVERIKVMHARGYIITIMWHHPFPTFGDFGPQESVWSMADRPSQEIWDELTTPGTPLQKQWISQARRIVTRLEVLRDARIPVLWRPYHEMNGVWFWWCNKKGPEGFRKLWIMMYDYFVKERKLDNLLWVWNTNAPRDRPNDEAWAYDDFYPGHDYVDVLAADVYRNDWKQSHHDDLLKLAGDKPIALGEVGNIPTPEILQQQPCWTWFMPWGNLLTVSNQPEAIKNLYTSPRVAGLEEIARSPGASYRIVKS